MLEQMLLSWMVPEQLLLAGVGADVFDGVRAVVSCSDGVGAVV